MPWYQVTPIPMDDSPTTAPRSVTVFPFYNSYSSPEQRSVGVPPFYSKYRDERVGRRTTHVLWPLWRSEKRDDSWAYTERESTSVLPLFHQMAEEDERYGPNQHQYLFPFYFQGTQAKQNGRYVIVFPFFWYAENARMVTPLFPKRPQTFAAFWPFFGHFENYWNRHTIDYVLWPLFVRSIEGKDPEVDKITHYTFLWPIFGYYDSKVMGGFNVWPLVSRVEKPDEYLRAYWLWPLGHYRYEVVPEWSDKRSEETWFLPFYADATTPKYNFDLVFPFYGDLEMKGRRSRGYALAVYNTNENYRSSIRQHRLLWFLIRWTTRIDPNPKAGEFVLTPEPMQGGGFFPFYTKTWNSEKVRVSAPWPIYTYRKDREAAQIYTRQFLFPFFGRTVKEFPVAEGDSQPAKPTETKRYVWPFYRKTTLKNGHTYTNIPHFFPGLEVNDIDRNYSALWSVYRAERDPQTGARTDQFLGSVYKREKTDAGDVRKSVRLLVYSRTSQRGSDGSRSGETKWLFGLLKHRWEK